MSAYEMLAGELPTTAQGLQALVVEPKPKPKRWQQFFLRIPPDPWGNDFVYVRPGKHNPQSYDLFSKGPDGLENTADDIGNW